ncbi:MAG TPA: hypothetical protein EYP53_10410 [Candidatus Latescibacteria bacterium]|nr:hypothetical protein [Candidatus Latescibacterota bacterium]
MSLKRFCNSLLILVFITVPLYLGAEQLYDRIIAVVDDQVILQSELREVLGLELLRRGIEPDQKEMVEQLKKELLEAMINDRVLLIKAKRDSIVIKDREINDALNEELERIKGQFSSPQEYERQLKREGLTERELRKRYREEIKNYLLKQKVMASLAQGITVSRREVVDFFRANADSLPRQPEMVNISHILLKPSVDREQAYQRIQQLLERIRSGEDFDMLAQEYSEDPGSAGEGGDLGWFTRGTMLPEFEEVAFSLEPGQISDVVETDLGYHIIKVEEKDGDKVRARHILIRTAPSEDDIKAVVNRLAELRRKVVDGEDFADLARMYSQDTQTAAEGGLLGWIALDQLPPAFKTAIDRLSVGKTSQPFRSWLGFHIVRLNERKSERPLSLEQDYQLLENMVRQEKLKEAFNRLIASEKQKIYVDVRLEEQ